MAVAYLSEVFSSIQGEGMDAGAPAVFLRFAGCNLACSYCDTPAAGTPPDAFPVHGDRGTTEIGNPIECSELIDIVAREFGFRGLAVLTGGEPLLQISALSRVITGLREEGFSTYLETNGTLAEAMREVRAIVDFVSMDIKLPAGQEGRDLSREHRKFLEVIEEGRGAVKIVIPGEASDVEVLAAVRLVAGAGPAFPVFLQPVFREEKPDVTGERLLHLQRAALALVEDVRISVQIHKILGMR